MDLNNKKHLAHKNKTSFRSSQFNRVMKPVEILANPARPDWLFLPPDKLDLIFLDFETTGGNPSNSSIIEIGAVKYSNGKEVDRFETLIKPKHPISKIVEKITKINKFTVENSPYFEDISSEFFAFIGDCPIIAHGALGDMAYIYHHYKEQFGEEFQNFYFCTHLLVSHFLPNIPSKTLSGVAQYFEIPLIPAHKAMNDALLTCEVFWKLVKIFGKHNFKNCIDIFKIQADNEILKKLGPGINPNLSEIIPAVSGVVFLTNPDQEISFLTASQNIRKTYHKLTTHSTDKDLNKIITHVEGFKYDRTNNFLDALIREKNQLKKITLSLDPRKLQNRSENFVQIFIPEDMLEFATHNPFKVPFQFILNATTQSAKFVDVEENFDLSHFEDKTDGKIEKEVTLNKVPIQKTRKNLTSPQSKKFLHTRTKTLKDSLLDSGNLKFGIGYTFGPFEKPKLIETWIQELLEIVPYTNNNLSMKLRFHYLKILISYLNKDIENEILYFKNIFLKPNSLKELSYWPNYLSCLNKSKSLLKIENLVHKKNNLRSGLAVISNNELKEFEVFVVIQGIITQKIRLPIEQSSKLKSARFITRIFEPHSLRLHSQLTPILFDEESCSQIELFTYWLENKRGEGEWIDFYELEPLYDSSIL